MFAGACLLLDVCCVVLFMCGCSVLLIVRCVLRFVVSCVFCVDYLLYVGCR